MGARRRISSTRGSKEGDCVGWMCIEFPGAQHYTHLRSSDAHVSFY